MRRFTKDHKAAKSTTKKRKLIRAALMTLANLPTVALLEALDGIEKLMPGRPAH